MPLVAEATSPLADFEAVGRFSFFLSLIARMTKMRIAAMRTMRVVESIFV
jgi:hypothetical protein